LIRISRKKSTLLLQPKSGFVTDFLSVSYLPTSSLPDGGGDKSPPAAPPLAPQLLFLTFVWVIRVERKSALL